MAEPTTLEDRVLKLERGLRWLRVTTVLVLALAAGLAYVTMRESRELFVSDSLVVPRGFLVGPGPFAGVGPSKDGKDIVLWFAQHGNNAQTRIGFERREQALTFTDSHGKLRIWLGIASDGSAKLRLLDAAGREIWSTPPPAQRGAV